MARQWILNSQDGFEKSLEYQQVEIPKISELGPNEVLVKLYAASLNYRELIIAGPVVRFLNQELLCAKLTGTRASTDLSRRRSCQAAMEPA